MKINKKNIAVSTSTAFCLLTAHMAIAADTWGAPSIPGGVPTDIEIGLMNMINWVLGFVSLVAVLMVIWGGVQYLTSAGDETRSENGKKTVTYAFIGLVITGLAYGIVEVIVVKILM
jgi:heme/copper-type cytochrome/quinol oxidase subunit 2